jgi:hypothetical protein
MYEHGMTLRDYFAAKAMQGLMRDSLNIEVVCQSAYLWADEMMKARDE